MAWAAFDVSKNTSGGLHVRKARGVRKAKLTEDVHYEDNIRTSDGQLDEASHKVPIGTRIRKESAILICELQVCSMGKEAIWAPS